jgi:hypothetical protein
MSPSDPGDDDGAPGESTVGPVLGTPPDEVVDVAESTFSEVAVSSGLIEAASRTVPTVVAEAVFSPFVLLEVLFRALGRTMTGLVIPLMLTLLVGLLLAWRLRPGDKEWDDTSVSAYIADHSEGSR